MMPKRIGAWDMVRAATDSDPLEHPLNRVYSDQGLSNSFSWYMMAQSTEHAIEHGYTNPSIVPTETDEEIIEFVI
jgi:hypothetical protein